MRSGGGTITAIQIQGNVRAEPETIRSYLQLKEGDEVTALIINVDRKTRGIQLSIKAKDNAEQQEAMQTLRADTTKEGSGTTSLGALLKAKLDQNNG